MTTYNEHILDALAHVRRFLDANAHETVTGHHDALERLRKARVRAGDVPETKALDALLARVLNMAHSYANER